MLMSQINKDLGGVAWIYGADCSQSCARAKTVDVVCGDERGLPLVRALSCPCAPPGPCFLWVLLNSGVPLSHAAKLTFWVLSGGMIS